MIVSKSTLRRRVPVTAIHSDELEPILRRLGLYEVVVKGNARCYFCKELVTMDSIGGLMEIDGEVRLICSNPKCLIKAAMLSAERNEQQPL